jgi:chromosome segregation ATPase
MKRQTFFSGVKRVLLGGLVLATGFLAGQFSPPVVGPWGESEQHAPGAEPPVETEGQDAASSPEQVRRVLARLEDRLQDLLARRRALEVASREAQIAYGLLRGRSRGEGSEECRRLAARQRRIEEEIQEVQQQLEETQEIEARLRLLADQMSHVPGEGATGLRSLREARALLALGEACSPGGLPFIPDESWSRRSEHVPASDRSNR